MNKKYIAITVVAIAIILGLILYVRAGGDSAKYNIENWTGNLVEGITGAPEGPMGAITFSEGGATYDQLARDVLQKRTVLVTATQVNELSDDEDGIILIPAVGSNEVIQVESIVGFNRFSSESWSRVAGNESFEIKWDSGALASGGTGRYNLGASFSNGFLTAAATTTTASKGVEVWRPYIPTDTSVANFTLTASSSAVVLSGFVNPSNVETDITDFVFEVFYRILPKHSK